MKIEILDAAGRPVVLEGSRVVVRDTRTNTPLLVAVETAPVGGQGSILAASASDNNFGAVLRSLRIDDTVIVRELKNLPLPTI